MITDEQTNFLYLADSLPKLYPTFYSKSEKVLRQCGIKPELLPNTNDVWAVDYMPIQVQENTLVQFVYKPSYLKTKKEIESISDIDSICKGIGIATTKSKIFLDGGNVVRSRSKVIMTDRIFEENPTYSRKQLITELEELFQIDKLYFIPEQPKDFTGHADGMVRFLNEDTVIINDYKKEKPEFRRAFLIALDNAGLEYIEIPYNPYKNTSYIQAQGCYINYLQMENVVIVPKFGLEEDEQAERQLQELFHGQTVVSIDSNDIADDGGILNCISWNIKK